MKKADMITVIARQTAAAWANLMQYELDLHIRNFNPGEIDYTEFSKYCESDAEDMSYVGIWDGIMRLCESLGIDYKNMGGGEDKFITIYENRAFQANKELMSRMKGTEEE